MNKVSSIVGQFLQQLGALKRKVKNEASSCTCADTVCDFVLHLAHHNICDAARRKCNLAESTFLNDYEQKYKHNM